MKFRVGMCLVATVLAACGGGDSGNAGSSTLAFVPFADVTALQPGSPPGDASIGGTVAGLQPGQTVKLSNRGIDSLLISENGAFAFALRVPLGQAYEVTVASTSGAANCALLADAKPTSSSISNGTISSGVASANVSDLRVLCSSVLHRVAGHVAGLPVGATVSLLNNGQDRVDVASNGSFQFNLGVPDGGSYNISILASPAGYACSIANLSGQGTDVHQDIGNVSIICTARMLRINGKVAGLLPGQSVAVANNAGAQVIVNADGDFAIPEPASYLSSYNVGVVRQPGKQTCSVLQGSGTAITNDISNVYVTCYEIRSGISLDSGAVLSGYKVSNPNGPCIDMHYADHVTIVNNVIGPCQATYNGIGVQMLQSNNIQILNNSFDDVASAVYAVLGGSNILIEGNHATKIRGPAPRGQLVQLNQVRGSGVVIRCNVSDQSIGGDSGGPSDQINIYQSFGSPASPILVELNKLRGGWAASGGGIMTGDGYSGGNIVVSDNVLVDAGQYGIAVASGTNIELSGNTVFGTQHPWSNVGIYVWSQGSPEPACSNIKVGGNRVNYLNRDGNPNPWWDAGNCGQVDQTPANGWADLSLSADVWNAPLAACAISKARPY